MERFIDATSSPLKHLSVIAKILLLVFSISILGLPANAQGVVSDGQAIFKKCSVCHKVGAGAVNGIGPVLTTVVGRTAGTAAGYKFGKSMKAAGEAGLVWDEDLIVEYLANPKKFLKTYLNDKKAKAKMRFRLKKLQDRQNVAAYLASLKSM